LEFVSDFGFRISDLPCPGVFRCHRFAPNHLAHVLVASLPAVPLLPRADKDLLARLGFAVSLHEHVRDVALVAQRRRQQAQVGAVPPLLPPRTAWCLPKDHDVLGHRPGNPQPEPYPAVDETNGQGFNRAVFEYNRLWRPREHFRANPPPRGIDTFEVHFTAKWTRLPQPGMTLHLRSRNDPSLALLLGQPLAPCLRDGPKSTPRPPTRRRAHVPRNDVQAPTQPSASHIEDIRAAPATHGNIKYLHVVSFLKFAAALLGNPSAPGSPAIAAGRPLSISLPDLD
jgi:hypothetical protein